MQVTSKSGMKMEVEISGFQQEPIIELVSPKEVQGRNIAGRISIGQEKNAVERGFHARGRVFIQGEDAVSAVEAEIAKLPKKIYRIYLETATVNLDGDVVEFPRWHHEGFVPGASESDIVIMLEAVGITEISIEDATAMWNAKVEAELAPFREQAKETGKPVEISRTMVECTDPREECSADIAIRYMHPNGEITTKYAHTY